MRTNLHRTVAAVAALVALVTALPAAHAAEPAPEPTDAQASARIAELNETGARAYAERNYRAAIEKFVEAYAIDHDPNLLFNIARCYEKLGDLGAAIEKYQAFVAAPGADTQGRIKAKESLAELRQLRDREGGDASAQPASGDEQAQQAAPPDDASKSGGTPIVPWVTLGAGVVVTGIGATFYALGVHDHAQVTNTAGYGDASSVYPMTRAEAQDYVDSGNAKKLIGGIGLGVGGALVATGVVLLVTGKGKREARENAPQVTLVPSATGVLAGYGGRF